MIEILVFLVIIALIWWVIQTLELPPMITKVATIILVIFVCLWLLNMVAPGTLGSFNLKN